MSKKFHTIKCYGKDKKGFTLIELIVVVVLMGIVAAVAIPSFASYRGTINKKDCMKNQKLLKVKIEEYKTGDYPYMSSPNKTWTAGSYDPKTGNWDGALATEAFSYATLDENGKYVSQDYFPSDLSEGDRFLMYAYNYVPGNDIKFPSTSAEGCQLYLVYHAATNTERSYVEIKCTREDHNPEESYKVYFSK